MAECPGNEGILAFKITVAFGHRTNGSGDIAPQAGLFRDYEKHKNLVVQNYLLSAVFSAELQADPFR